MGIYLSKCYSGKQKIKGHNFTHFIASEFFSLWAFRKKTVFLKNLYVESDKTTKYKILGGF